MTNSLRPHGHPRVPLPQAEQPTEQLTEQPTDGVPAPRSPHIPPQDSHSATGATAPEAGPVKQRDAFFDNAKYLAIVFVAMGHVWQPLTAHSRAAEALYMVVYTFHMPAFILISGYFSRSFDMRPDRLRRLITGVAVPYVVFEVTYSLFRRWAGDDSTLPISLLDPWYLTWFLAALFVWRMTTPLWKAVRWPVPLALGIAVLASVSPDIGDDLDLQRVLQFLPFFVIGLFMKPEHFRRMRHRDVRILSVPAFAAALAVAYWAVPRMNSAWFYHRDSAQELGAPWWAGIVMTLALLGCSLVLTVCFLAWVPGRRTWFTVLGAGTLYGYLLHGFLIQGSRFWGWYDAHPWVYEPLGQVFLTLLAAAVVTALCTPPVQRMFRFVMEPKMEWAFRRDTAEPARERGGRADART
ncbi:acyltransferase family protein [Streptomyces poonensis]|uniref:Membrane protein n=1 Tax=Streptomyces poonensis TaxID=68255 RepID=A0A918UL96_9ACTN|nr:acyltransferase family protein [Streptomyces poonensis]GGZ18303.1 membrane protein [Streptomyces poonensis]GLJ93440.1 membrane protein [Streptomyces poonensis]